MLVAPVSFALKFKANSSSRLKAGESWLKSYVVAVPAYMVMTDLAPVMATDMYPLPIISRYMKVKNLVR